MATRQVGRAKGRVVGQRWLSSPAWSHICRYVAPSLIVNGLGPLVLYTLLRPHLSELAALSATLAIPLGEGALTLARHRRLNVFGAMVATSLVLSMVAVGLGGTPRMLLMRESFLSGAFGIMMLLSLPWRQPLVYYIARHFIAGHVPARADDFHRKATVPWLRQFFWLLTLVWGLVTAGDAAINIYLATCLSIPTYLLVTPLARYSIMGAALAWTLAHAHRGRYLAYLFA